MGSNSDETYTLDKSKEDLNEEDNQSNKSYILNKFLGAGGDGDNKNRSLPPLPKPRTKIGKSVNQRRDSMISQETFKVTSPKIVAPKISRSNNSNTSSSNNESEIEKGEIENLSDHPASIIDDSEEKSVLPDLTKIVKIDSKYKYDDILEIIIHKTDRLKLDSFISHPMVKIIIVDMKNGSFLKKSSKFRPVVFFYEDESVETISPVMTSPYNLQANRSLIPNWEESIIYNEDFQYFLDERENLIIFFEILDFRTFSDMNKSINRKGLLSNHQKEGWSRIAFAFLKLSGRNGGEFLNLGRKIRLQLYYYPQNLKNNTDIYKIWTKNRQHLLKYPSSLYVSIKKSQMEKKYPLNNSENVLRSTLPTQRENVANKEKVPRELDDETDCLVRQRQVSDDDLTNDFRPWTRKKSTDKCKIPKQLQISFGTNDDGCFVMRFSHDGLFLACAIKIDDLYGISIIRLKDFEKISEFPCHLKLIYSIVWSENDDTLMTCSGDMTVVVYNLTEHRIQTILPHECFLYCCEWFGDFIVTGGFDKVVRIWSKIDDNNNWGLCQELAKHEGFLTCVVCESGFLYSSSCVGEIFEWGLSKKENLIFKRIVSNELKGAFINHFVFFPHVDINTIDHNKKILVCCRDYLRILDLKSGCILYNLYYGGDDKLITFCSISPCGSLVLCGGGNGLVYFWDLSKKIARNCEICDTLNIYEINFKVSCVQFHPNDNLFAVSHYGSNLPIHIYIFDGKNQEIKDYLPKNSKKKLEMANKLHFNDILVKMDNARFS